MVSLKETWHAGDTDIYNYGTFNEHILFLPHKIVYDKWQTDS